MANALRYFKEWTAYFLLCCVVLTSQQPAQLIAQDGTCILMEPGRDEWRSKTATIVAGAATVAVIGGIAYIALGSSGGCHSHSSSSCSSSYSNYNPPFFSSSSYSRDSYGHHHHHHHHHHHSNYYSSFSSGSSSGFEYHSSQDPQIFERNIEGNQPARTRYLAARNKKSKKEEADQISGVFTIHPSLSASTKGSITVFVQMPDGSIQNLGNLSFSANAGCSLTYGPFKQKGNYLFGIRLDQGATFSSQTKVCTVEVHLNGTIVECYDFFAPAHASTYYEPTPCEYSL